MFITSQNSFLTPVLQILILSYCIVYPLFTHAQPSPAINTDIHIGIDLWPGYYPVILAKQLGFFHQQQLEVEISHPENTDKLLTQFNTEVLDAICVAAGDLILNHHLVPNSKIVLITDLSAGGDALLSLKKLPSSLNGLKIGTNIGGFGELFIEEFLRSYNTQRENIQLVNVDASKAFELLQSRQLDIVHTWEPYVSEATNQGATIVFNSWQTPGLIPDVLAFNGHFIEQHPEAIKHFIQAWWQALTWWQQHPIEAQHIIQRFLGNNEPVSLKGIKLMNRADNIESFTNPNKSRNLTKVINRYIDFFTQHQLLKTAVTPQDIINGNFL